MDLSQAFRHYRFAHFALLHQLRKEIVKKVIAEYNNKMCRFGKIEKCRIQISHWNPDQKSITIDVQAWIEGPYSSVSEEYSKMTNGALKEILHKHLPQQKGFEINSYIQNISVDHDND